MYHLNDQHHASSPSNRSSVPTSSQPNAEPTRHLPPKPGISFLKRPTIPYPRRPRSTHIFTHDPHQNPHLAHNINVSRTIQNRTFRIEKLGPRPQRPFPPPPSTTHAFIPSRQLTRHASLDAPIAARKQDNRRKVWADRATLPNAERNEWLRAVRAVQWQSSGPTDPRVRRQINPVIRARTPQPHLLGSNTRPPRAL